MILRSFLVLLLANSLAAHAQTVKPNWWRAALQRTDGASIVFNFEWLTENGKPVWYIRNASERIRVTDIQQKGDSMVVQMPLFESQFRIKKSKDGNQLNGVWIKGGAVRTSVIPFSASKSGQRFPGAAVAMHNISGRWSASFENKNNTDPAIAEFTQRANYITGTFLNPTGDYRYLEGVVSNDTLQLSCFDGGHAFLFTALIDDQQHIRNGWFYSGASFKQPWHAIKNDTATLPEDDVAMYLRPGGEKLHFTFNDLDGKPVSINDARFMNKVVVVQLMGSWCPNCMDETAFLSNYYNKNKDRGVEVLSLAYEYSTDRERSVKTLRKFQQRFNVQYPMLITGVTVNDSLRTEKTLPELTPIKFFPSSVILDKKGNVRKLDTGFNGPGTGDHYLKYKKEFEDTIDKLLAE
ncbi:MAG TPA: TlpA disulfide reductase family protein [Chitinophagaceae bacterium]|nr:TlpA disulfide reductase family protein [Chitinophagaceae bacterium]